MKTPQLPTIQGDKWRSHYKSQVVSIMGGDAPPVSSRGAMFYNKDRWTLRVLTTKLCEWASQNPGRQLTHADLKALVKESNTVRVTNREIVIARTPSRLSKRTAFALIGGADHEAFHSVYSRRSNLKLKEVLWVLGKWAQVPDWSKFHKMLQTWSNLVEDIRIERVGRVDFPGTLVKLHDLQDFILKQELEGEANARAHGVKTAGVQTVVMATFRDVGLGYVTSAQEEAMDRYRASNPEAVKMVLDGPLSDLLRESIALSDKQDVACLRIAFDVVIELFKQSGKSDPDRKDGDDDDDSKGEGDDKDKGGDGDADSKETKCPKCKAKGSKLVIRPLLNGAGHKVPNKGLCTCTVCGWQDTVDVPEPTKGKGKPSKDKEEGPKFEGFDQKPSDQPGQDGDTKDDEGDDTGEEGAAGGAGDATGDDTGDDTGDATGGTGSGEGEDGDEDPTDGDTADGGASDGKGEAGEGEGTDGSEASDGADGEASDGADGKTEDAAYGPGDDVDGSDGDSAINDADGTKGERQDGGGSGSGGSHVESNGPLKGSDWSNLAGDILDNGNEDAGLKNNNTALGDALKEAQASEKARDKVKQGEALYRPLDTGLDDVRMVGPSQDGKAHDSHQAAMLLKSVKSESSFLRARMRNIVKALEMTSTIHGLRRGRSISERFLVDTKVAMMAGKAPQRAFWQQDEAQDTSLAAAIVLDQSGSMHRILKDATRIICALTEPLDALGCAVQVSGFRNGRSGVSPYSLPPEEMEGVHRYQGVTHDVFKTFEESFRAVKYRFANTQATGTTPMADGIQFGLDSLSFRKEGHRVLFVVTDGDPDGGHQPVIRRQLRLAKESGILVIGVGVGHGARNVPNLYPDHVWSGTVADLPKMLISKLNSLMDATVASKRGRSMKKTG